MNPQKLKGLRLTFQNVYSRSRARTHTLSSLSVSTLHHLPKLLPVELSRHSKKLAILSNDIEVILSLK